MLAGWIKAHVVTILESILDLYFVRRAVDWMPSSDRPRLGGRIVATRRVERNFYQVLIQTDLGERRWIDVRRGKRDDKTGRWAFYEE